MMLYLFIILFLQVNYFFNILLYHSIQVRAEALGKLQGFVTSAEAITSNLGEAAPIIAARISDSNTKISASAIALVESLAPAMGSPCRQYIRVFLPALMKAIGDPKVNIIMNIIFVYTLLNECIYL